MRILILGGNGFIGSAVAKLLADRGHQVTALSRDIAVAKRRMPDLEWVRADIARLAAPDDWVRLISGIDAVVNCAGALQDSARDDLAALQDVAMRALWQAARSSSVKLIVHISARMEGGAAETPFLATKRSADIALKNSGVPFVILRPAIVVGRNAHGGAALLRALAAFPLFTPLAHAGSTMRFAALDDVAERVLDAVEARIAPGADIEIAGAETLSLQDAVAAHREWLGLPKARTMSTPQSVAGAVAFAADALGHLGWRSPLRSTAMTVAAGGIGAPGETAANDSRRLQTLAETLAAGPAGVQDLWFARFYLMKPIIFATLSMYWLFSGIIALLRFEASAALLAGAGAPSAMAAALTIVTSLVDISLGAGVVIRRYSALA